MADARVPECEAITPDGSIYVERCRRIERVADRSVWGEEASST